MKRNRKAALGAVLAAAMLLTSGCLQSSDDNGGGGDGGDGGTAGAGGSNPNDGVVEIFGAFTGAEQDAFNEALKSFEDESGIDIKGKNAVVIGRSDIVGSPVSYLLKNADATVTVCHSRTRDLAIPCCVIDALSS